MLPLVSSRRHPELVSGSTLRHILHDGRQTKANSQIHPFRVLGTNEVDFPSPMPIFQLLFARNRTLHVAKHFKMDQAMYRIFGRMSGHHGAAMLIKTIEQVRGYADIKRTVRLARQNVHAGVFSRFHQRIVAAKWTLKQVQGDGLFASRALLQRQRNEPRHPELVSGSTGRLVRIYRSSTDGSAS
jgi:hypothetical protein